MQKPFITKESSTVDVMNFYGNQVNQNLYQMTQVIRENNAKCEQQYRELEKKVNAVGRKKRRMCVERQMVTKPSGEIVVCEVFDDDSQEIKPFIGNAMGTWQVNLIWLKTVDNPAEKYLITFSGSNIWIIGNRKKLTGSKLREAFIKAGVNFYPSFSKNIMEDVLFQTFAPLIENCNSKIEFQELAGWNQGKYVFWERLQYPVRTDFPKLPIQEKHFLQIGNGKEKLLKFCVLYAQIKRWEDRLYLLEIQILGLLASIFHEEKVPLNFFLNLVFLENIPEVFVVRLLQIFNRDTFHGLRGDANEKELHCWLNGSNDEVVIVDANVAGNDYRKKKAETNVEAVAKKICQKGNSLLGIDRDITASLVILNHQSMCLPGCVNIMVSKEFVKSTDTVENLLDDFVVEAFLSEFICFAEYNLQNIRYLIRQENAKNIKNEQKLLQAAFQILKSFGEAQGIDFAQELKLPWQIDFSDLVEEVLSKEDMKKQCIQAIRKDMQHWQIIKKGYGIEFVGNACYYDETKIWIPTKIFDRMLGRNGLLPYKMKFLAAVKEERGLCTDAEGLSTRLQIGQKRVEAYAFLRDTFDLSGALDIVYLGKEGQ